MSDINVIKTNTLTSWGTDIEFARMETLNSIISDTFFLVLKKGDSYDLDFWHNKAKIFTKTFSSIPDNIRMIM